MYRFFYGLDRDNSVDVTDAVYTKWCFRNLNGERVIHIPCSDYVRADMLGDPFFGYLKRVYIYDMVSRTSIRCVEHDEECVFTVQSLTPDNDQSTLFLDQHSADTLLTGYHTSLRCDYGSFDDEYNEQRMSVRFVSPDARVLEIGGHIGRNSLVMASILKNSSNLVVLEPDPSIAKKLRHNRDLNLFSFHVEECALSRHRLIQEEKRGTACRTLVCDEHSPVPDGFHEVKTCLWSDMKKKYPHGFDTLVYDCEGAFLHILADFPDILDSFTMILQENDFESMDDKLMIDTMYRDRGFVKIFVEEGGWPWSACRHCFFEVWRRL